jgi:hypothetical protein
MIIQVFKAKIKTLNHNIKIQKMKRIKPQIVVQELGSGQFGSVVEVLDLINKVTKAEKTLKKKE